MSRRLLCLLALLLAAIGSANAQRAYRMVPEGDGDRYAMAAAPRTFGPYLCSHCSDMPDVGGQVTSVAELTYMMAWIEHNPPTSLYRPGDTKTVCNGQVCQVVAWRLTSGFYPLGKAIPNAHIYKNAASPPLNPGVVYAGPDAYVPA